MADNFGVGALGGVVLVDPATGLPYKAEGGGGGGGAVDSVNGQTGVVVLDAEDVGARPDDWTPTKADVGLGNVTDDAQLKASDLDTDPDLTADSDAKVPSQKAVKAYVDANAGGAAVALIKLVATAAQSTTVNDAPFRVTLGGVDINLGGDHLTTTSGYVEAKIAGVYRATGYVPVSSCKNPGHKNVLIFKTTGTPDPLEDEYIVRTEETAAQTTGSWSSGGWLVNLAIGDRLYLGFVQHTVSGSTPHNMALNEDPDAPSAWMSVELVKETA